MQINNQPNLQNFQGFLKFKTAQNLVKIVDANKISTIASGAAIVSQGFNLCIYNKDLVNPLTTEARISPNHRNTSGVKAYREEIPIAIKVQQIIYSDPRMGLPNNYTPMLYRDKEHISNPYIEGSDYVVISDKKMSDALVVAAKTSGVVDISKDCGEIPWQGVLALDNYYLPIIKNNSIAKLGFDVAEAYMSSAQGIAAAESEIKAEDVLISINENPIEDISKENVNMNSGEALLNQEIVEEYRNGKHYLTEDEKLEIVDFLGCEED